MYWMDTPDTGFVVDHWLYSDPPFTPCSVHFLIPRCDVGEAEPLDAIVSKTINCEISPWRDRTKNVTLAAENVGVSGEDVNQISGLLGDPALELGR
jgi:hypothetical protein